MVGLLSFAVGGLAGFGKKKTGNGYYLEQTAAFSVSTLFNAVRMLANRDAAMRPAHLLWAPGIAAVMLGSGNVVGRMVYDVRAESFEGDK